MLKEILQGKTLQYVMLALCGIGIISKLAVWISYRRLTKATEDMANSKNALTRQLKLKFENCYKLNLNVQNVSVFVDRYIQKYKVFGVRIHTVGRILQASVLLTVLLGFCACAGSFLYELGTQRIVLFASSAILSVLVLNLVEYLLDVGDKRSMAVTNLQDYLENVLTNRLHLEYEDDPESARVSAPAVQEQDAGLSKDSVQSQPAMASVTSSAAGSPAGKRASRRSETIPEKGTADLVKLSKAQTAASSLAPSVNTGAAATNLKIKKRKESKKAKGNSIDEEEVIREILREFLQ